MFDTETVYEVNVFSIGDTKSGTKMGKLQLKDPKDETLLNCVLWEEALNRMDEKIFRTGNQVRIASGSYNEKFNNCLISSLELVKEAKIGIDKAEQDKTYNEIVEYINKISDVKLKKFISDYFKEHEEQIKIAPAAKAMHHNYLGGLLVHTLECLKLAEANLNLLNTKIDSDKVFAACILHDIGKIFEYTINTESGLIDYDENFRKDWISHSQYGFSICMMEDFKDIAKMIAAHHARSEWGALIDLDQKDLDPIAYFMHHVDDLSAKYGRINVSMI